MAYSSKKQTKYLRGYLFEKFFDGHVLFRVFLHNLGHSHLEVLLGHVDSPLPEGVHTGLSTNTLYLSTEIRKVQKLVRQSCHIRDISIYCQRVFTTMVIHTESAIYLWLRHLQKEKGL